MNKLLAVFVQALVAHLLIAQVVSALKIRNCTQSNEVTQYSERCQNAYGEYGASVTIDHDDVIGWWLRFNFDGFHRIDNVTIQSLGDYGNQILTIQFDFGDGKSEVVNTTNAYPFLTSRSFMNYHYTSYVRMTALSSNAYNRPGYANIEFNQPAADDDDDDVASNYDFGYGGDCFPSHSTIFVKNQGQTKMEDVRVGDYVQSMTFSGEVLYKPVYFFGHRDPDVMGDFITVNLEEQDEDAQNRKVETLTLSPNHFAIVCVHNCDAASLARGVHTLKHVHARRLRIGDVLLGTVHDDEVASHLHTNTSTHTVTFLKIRSLVAMPQRGQFAPFVRGAMLVVDGVVASPHASWLSPAFHLLGIYSADAMALAYEALYTPIFLSYVLGGERTHRWVLETFRLEQGPTQENWWLSASVLCGYYYFYVLILRPMGAVCRSMGRLVSTNHYWSMKNSDASSRNLDLLTVACFLVGWTLMLGRFV